MNWICPQCLEELGEYNAYCVYCKQDSNIIIFNPDKYCIREVCIYHITEGQAKPMTPQEELFAEFFNKYKHEPKVNAMTDLELRAHREELQKIAFEARAYVYAVDDILKERKPKGPKGFERSVNVDDTATEAINTIRERQKRITKADKILAGLEKLGIDPKYAAQLMSAGTIVKQIRKDEAEKEVAKPITPIFNPFEKK